MTASKDGKDVKIKGPNGAEYSASNDGKTATIKDDKGNSTTVGFGVTEADLGLPFYPDSTEVANGGSTSNANGVHSVMCQRTTKDDPEKVTAFYKDKIEGGESSNSTMGDMKMASLSGGKLKDGSEVAVMAMKNKGEDTSITITVQHGKK
jgi:hypothetical protein